jgi:hypothetical protein
MNSIPTNTSLVQRIENALASSDLHSAEIAGLIEAAMAAEARFENLISQLTILHTAVLAQEKHHQSQNPKLGFLNEPEKPRHQGEAKRRVAEKPQPRVKSYVVGSMQDPNAPF